MNITRIQHAISELRSVTGSDDTLILIGGGVLEAYGLRRGNDIDFAVHPGVYKRLQESAGKYGAEIYPDRIEFALSSVDKDQLEKIDIKLNAYENLGFDDQRLLDDHELTFSSGPVRVAKLELEFGRNLHTKSSGNPRTIRDRIMIEQYALNDPSWRWDLVPVSAVSPTDRASKAAASRSLMRRLRKIRPTFRRLLKVARHPAMGFRSAKRIIAKRLPKKPVLSARDLCVLQMNVGTILQLQCNGSGFNRYDTLLRYLTFFWHTQGTGDAFTHYERMQRCRVNRETTIVFKQLISSVQRSGFAVDRHPILLNHNGALVDGSHRLACALAVGADTIPVRIERRKAPRAYNRSWFHENDFDDNVIHEMDRSLTNILIDSGAAFELILWPPAQSFVDAIEDDIRAKYQVIAKSVNAKINNLAGFVRQAYANDDIAAWKIEKKIYHMAEYAPVVSVFSFVVTEPEYRTKAVSGSYLSTAMESLKSELRNRYKHQLRNYIYDILLHIGDNPVHNRQMVSAMRDYGLTIGPKVNEEKAVHTSDQVK